MTIDEAIELTKNEKACVLKADIRFSILIISPMVQKHLDRPLNYQMVLICV